MLNDNNIKDIENAILRKIVPRNAVGDNISIGYSGKGRYTFVSVSWIDKKGVIHTRHGIGVKRKGDKYNKFSGQIMALIDCLK